MDAAFLNADHIPPLADFTVLLDTGSSDLWLNIAGRGVELTNTSDLEALEGYGKGQVRGNIAFAEVQIGDFTIESQGASDFWPLSQPSELIKCGQHF